jgi:hypothetical protein
MSRPGAKWFFSAFWGALASSALVQACHNAADGLWGKVCWGLLATVWLGGNSYLWAMDKPRPES